MSEGYSRPVMEILDERMEKQSRVIAALHIDISRQDREISRLNRIIKGRQTEAFCWGIIFGSTIAVIAWQLIYGWEKGW